MPLRGFQRLRKFSTDIKTTKFFTTPKYYVNANPHIGHLYSSSIADAAQRWQQVYKRGAKIKFSTGTDEHGSKIQQAAHKNNTSTLVYCDKIADQFRKMALDYSISYTDFNRTSAENHKTTVKLFWNALKNKDQFYLSKYEGWYCVSDETFLSESQLNEIVGSDGKKTLVSAESGHPVEWSSEENYMFKLSQYQNDLNYWLKSNENAVRPKTFYKILLEYINQDGGLQDLSVSRPSSRVSWGIPVPDDPTQTVYVWLDALASYLTVTGYGTDDVLFKKCWPPDVQVIGKDILRFHGIYWPAFLIAANLEPPKSLFCHSHWTVNNEKMSKSKGNVVCPFESAKMYTPDGMRYFLLREGVAHSDGNFSHVKVMRTLNSELADTLGNLLNRCTASTLNPAQIFPKIDETVLEDMLKIDVTRNLMENVKQLPGICETHYENLNFYKVIDAIIATLHSANLFFETLKPWELKKTPENQEKLKVVLHLTLESLRVSGILLQPIIPNISKILLDKINIGLNERSFDNLSKFSWEDNEFKEQNLGTEKMVLFKKILNEESDIIKDKKV